MAQLYTQIQTEPSSSYLSVTCFVQAPKSKKDVAACHRVNKYVLMRKYILTPTIEGIEIERSSKISMHDTQHLDMSTTIDTYQSTYLAYSLLMGRP